ncbi:unnamed protein product [Tilletia caries]|nr:unnamed protein product [Tilletia caries]
MAFSRKLQWRSCRAQRGSGSKVAIFGEMETKEERRLLVKIDFFVMSFLMLMYWSNYLNRTNLTSAYVSGMREKLNFQGTQFNTVNTVFTVRYICRLIPNNLALQIVPARIWLPSMALIWSGLSMCLAAAKNPGHIMAIRFFQALAEAWLRRSLDLTTFLDYGTRKRSWASGAVSSPARRSSGVSSAECYKEPSFAPRRAIAGFELSNGYFYSTASSLFRSHFVEAECKLAVTRLPPRPHTKLEWNLVKRVLGRRRWYAFSALFAWSSMLESVVLPTFSYRGCDRLKHHIRPHVRLLPLPLARQLHHGRRLHPLRHPNPHLGHPFAAKFFTFSLAGIGYAGQGNNFAWANDVMRDDDQERAMVLASMNIWSNVVNLWWSIVLYPATDAPRFKKGMIATICVAVVTVIITLATRHLDVRERKRYRNDAVSRPNDNV